MTNIFLSTSILDGDGSIAAVTLLIAKKDDKMNEVTVSLKTQKTNNIESEYTMFPKPPPLIIISIMDINVGNQSSNMSNQSYNRRGT